MDAAKSGPCSRCGECYPPWVMDLHHRNPAEKGFGLHRSSLKRYSLEAVIAEVAKCDLLCANCHREVEHGLL